MGGFKEELANRGGDRKGVKAHLRLQETKKDTLSRKEWKTRLVRQLYEAGYNQTQVLNLFNFLDWVLVLPKRLEAEFWLELKAYEEEQQMPYITSVEQMGFDRGIKVGEEVGVEKGKRALVLKQLTRKIGSIPVGKASTEWNRALEQINTLSNAQLESLGEALLEFETITDLTTWLDNH